MPLGDIAVSLRGVKRLYMMGEQEVWALVGIDLDIARGEYVSIMGPSGSGKTTLFNMIGGLDLPTDGTVIIDGHDTRSMDSRQIAYLRCRRIGYIFQTFNLIEVLTALENVTLPMIFSGLSDQEAERRGRELLEMVGLGDRFGHRPDELSGGQQQRVAIARAMANDPPIILADEPTGNLDLRTGEEIISLLGSLNKSRGVTIITATHDHKMLAASDRVIYITDGRVESIKHRSEMEITFGEIDGRT